MNTAAWVIVVLLVVLFLVWIAYGRRNHEFVGLAPLMPGGGIRYLSNPSAEVDLPAVRPSPAARGRAPAPAPAPAPANGANGANGAYGANGANEAVDAEDNGDTTLDTSEEAAPRERSRVLGRWQPQADPPAQPGDAASPADNTITLPTPVPIRGPSGQLSGKEEICRQVLESHYGLPFPKVRPDFLRNPDTGHNLEIDGYCHQLRLGFEFNGAQHYNYPNSYHKSTQEFLRQVRRDTHKYGICKRLGIRLVVVPHNIPPAQLRPFILSQLASLGAPPNRSVYVPPAMS